MEDKDGVTHCPLREMDPTAPNTFKLDKLKLAELPAKQFDQVITTAAATGSLSNLPKEGLEAYKRQFIHHRDLIKESLGVTKSSV